MTEPNSAPPAADAPDALDTPDVPDVFDPRRYARGVPHDSYRTLRDHHPVAWQEEPEVLGWPAGPGFWAVTRHADVVRVLKDAGRTRRVWVPRRSATPTRRTCRSSAP